MTYTFARRLTRCGASLAVLVALVGCGGGSSSPGMPSVVTRPSPLPTATPTSAPVTPMPSVASMTLDSPAAQSLTISESGYSGTYTESDTCAPLSGAIARIDTASNAGGSAAYLVTPLSAGSCSITVTDSAGRSASVSVSVSTAAITIQ